MDAITRTCQPSGGATCAAAGSGDTNTTIDLPPGGQPVFTVNSMVVATTIQTIINHAEVRLETDPAPGNHVAVAALAVEGAIFVDGFESGGRPAWPKVVGED